MLTKNINKCSIVVAGAWNIRIFTPEWVAKNLLEESEVKVELTLISGFPQLTIFNEDVTIKPHKDMLIIGIKNVNAFDRAKAAMLNALNILTHTPITGLGVNIVYLESDPGLKLLENFKISDLSSISKLDYKVDTSNISRKLVKDKTILNFSLSYTKEKNVDLFFNYHFDTLTAASAKEVLSEINLNEVETKSTELLKNLYDVKLEEKEI